MKQPMITADSKPDYDAWGWDDYWSCREWMIWHQKLKEKYGHKKANEKWLLAWSKQSTWEKPYNWCKYESDFVKYMNTQGISTGNIISKLFTGAEKIVENVTDSAVNVAKGTKNLSKGVVSTTNVVKILVPVAITGVVAGLGYYVYKNYIKGDKKLPVPVLGK